MDIRNGHISCDQTCHYWTDLELFEVSNFPGQYRLMKDRVLASTEAHSFLVASWKDMAWTGPLKFLNAVLYMVKHIYYSYFLPQKPFYFEGLSTKISTSQKISNNLKTCLRNQIYRHYVCENKPFIWRKVWIQIKLRWPTWTNLFTSTFYLALNSM